MHGFFLACFFKKANVQPGVYNMLILICNGCVYMQIKLDRIYTKQGKQMQNGAASPETLIKWRGRIHLNGSPSQRGLCRASKLTPSRLARLHCVPTKPRRWWNCLPVICGSQLGQEEDTWQGWQVFGVVTTKLDAPDSRGRSSFQRCLQTLLPLSQCGAS